MANGTNPNTNKYKQKEEIDLWYLFNLFDSKLGFKKVNLVRNEELSGLTQTGKNDYYKRIKNKITPPVSGYTINLDDKKQIYALFYHNVHYFDIANFQKGVDNHTNYKALKQSLSYIDQAKQKAIVFMGGNLVGKEWAMSYLNNAKISVDETAKFVEYSGLIPRILNLMNDIKFMLKCGAEEIYLMNGPEEHAAGAMLNTNILAYVASKFGGKVKYIQGVSTILNIRSMIDGKEHFSEILLQTNTKTNSRNAKGNVDSSIRRNGNEFANINVPKFTMNGNATGFLEPNNFFPSGQQHFYETAKGSLPTPAPYNNNIAVIYVEKSGELTIIEGKGKFFREDTLALENALADEKATKEAYKNIIAERLNDMCQTKYDENNYNKDNERGIIKGA